MSAPDVNRGLFPLDEELGLLGGSLTPNLQEDLTHLATWMPFEKARQMLKRLRGVEVSEATARRGTERDGAAYVGVQEAAVEKIEKELPVPASGPEKQLLSVDGAMVPLVGGEWAEVKTLVLGVIEEAVMEGGEQVVPVRELSYFSRLTDASTFGRLSLVETHRRGVEKAGQVVAVTDGAEWIQGFIDYHRADAARVLDFPHAAEYISLIGEAIYGREGPETQKWLTAQLHALKHQGPASVLAELRTLAAEYTGEAEVSGWLAYLEKREAQMQYPDYRAQGWPIGSGAVESGNKVVVEVRLKGAGMHWAREHVNPMLALRNAVCNDRWDEAWTQISTYRQQQRRERRQARQTQKAAVEKAAPSDDQAPPTALPTPQLSAATSPSAPRATPTADTASPTQPRQPWKPPPDHPWRKYPACKSRRPQQ